MLARFFLLVVIAVGVVLWRVPSVSDYVNRFISGTSDTTVVVDKAIERMKALNIGTLEDWAEANLDEFMSGDKFLAFIEDLKPEAKDINEYCEQKDEQGVCKVVADVQGLREEITSLRGGISYNMAAKYMVRVYGWQTEEMTDIDYLEDITGRTPWKSNPDHILTFEDIAWLLARVETA